MYVTRLATEGLRHAPPALSDLERVVELPDPPARQAISDALTLLIGGLSPSATSITSLGWSGTVTHDDDGDPQWTDLDATAVGAMVRDDVRAVSIDARLRLDPPLYGRLRSEAARDPRVATALGQEPTVSVKVGWLLNADRTAVVPSLLGVRVGEVPFETTGRERPPWLPEIVQTVAGRFGSTDPFEPVAAFEQTVRAALLSPQPEVREGFQAWVRAVSAPPFSLPAPSVVEVGGRPHLVFGAELLRARQLGREAVDVARVCYAALVGRPDVLVVPEAVSAPLRGWLASLPEAEGAPIEQVWVAP